MSEHSASHRSASRSSIAVATLFALATALFLPLWGIAIGLVGAATVGVGTARGWRRVIDGGMVVQLAAVVYTVITTGAVGPLVIGVATLSAVAAWDAGRYGTVVDIQLGRGATTRIKIAHTVWTVALAATGLGVSYSVYTLVEGSGAVLGLLLALCGILALVGGRFYRSSV